MSLQAIEPVSDSETPAPVVSFTPRKSELPSHLLRGITPFLACLFALLLHLFPDSKSLPLRIDPDYYNPFLFTLLALSALIPLAQLLLKPLRPLLRHNSPLIAAAIVTLALWDLVTLKLNWLPSLYVPGPYRIIWVYATDWSDISIGLLYSLTNLLCGYAVGLAAGLVCGVSVGWSPRVRYWVMPVLKLVGPVPAVAWIPLAMYFAPAPFVARVGLIAMAVWFPVTMLTASGISSVRVTFFDVARTMGAKRGYLIFRIAIPAALPNIFLGCFMGLGTSFLTLIVAEAVGTQYGLGRYFSTAKENFRYDKVDAAIIVMAVFFSLIITSLFKLRDTLLVWQKGVIKW